MGKGNIAGDGSVTCYDRTPNCKTMKFRTPSEEQTTSSVQKVLATAANTHRVTAAGFPLGSTRLAPAVSVTDPPGVQK